MNKKEISEIKNSSLPKTAQSPASADATLTEKKTKKPN